MNKDLINEILDSIGLESIRENDSRMETYSLAKGNKE